jgi:hypothetical protein
MLINRLQHQLVLQKTNEAFTIPYTPLVIPFNDVVNKLPAPPASCARAKTTNTTIE